MQSMIDRITWKFCVPSRTRIGLRTEYLPETHRRLSSAVPPLEAASTLLNLTLKSVFWFRAELQPRWHHLNGDAWRCHDLRRVGRDSLTDVGHRAPHLDHRRSRRERHQERRVVEVLALDLADRRAAHVLQWLRLDFAMDDRSNHVSTVPHTETDPTTEHAGEEEAGPSKREPKEFRKRRPNTLVIGPTWKN